MEAEAENMIQPASKLSKILTEAETTVLMF